MKRKDPFNDDHYDGNDEQIEDLKEIGWELKDALALMWAKYDRLHDFLSDAIEEGRLTEDMIPDDYEAIVAALVDCLDADVNAKEVLGKLGGGDE